MNVGMMIMRPLSIKDYRLSRTDLPLAEWYDSRGIFHRINGDRDINEITSDILKSLS